MNNVIMKNHRHVELYYRTDINRCITLQEIKALIDFFPYGDRRRIAFSIMACTGIRGAEVAKITLRDFRDDWHKILVPVAKKKFSQYATGTNFRKIPVRPCTLPKSLVKELKWYIEANKHLLVYGRLFPFNTGTLRKYLQIIRDEIRETRDTNHPLIGLLEENRVQVILEAANNGEERLEGYEGHTIGKHFYRIELHSFRRTYETFMYNTLFGGDLVRLVRHMGYEFKHGKETAMRYLYTPEMIGLTPSMISEGLGFEELLYGKDQMKLDDF